jgi:hypothetical protein
MTASVTSHQAKANVVPGPQSWDTPIAVRHREQGETLSTWTPGLLGKDEHGASADGGISRLSSVREVFS